jgi:hypothetical protein
MLMTKLKTMAVALSVLAGVVIGAGALAQTTGDMRKVQRRNRGAEVKVATVNPTQATSVLKLPGPTRRERMEIIIDRGASSERLTIQAADNGTFVVNREEQGDKVVRQDFLLCTGIEITALRDPEPGKEVLARPRPEGAAYQAGAMNSVEREHEQRLDRMEQKLEQILKALEPRRDTSVPANSSRRGPEF